MTKKTTYTAMLVIVLVIFRVILGIQINFSHEDYDQIYLIGLEYAFNDNWSYWGPDVVWSETRLPGAMQGFLAGFPIQVFKHPYSPIIFSNLLSALGLILLALYGKKRFPALNLNFLLALLLLLPFYLYHGVVLLNTAYLVFTGALLFIPVFELFLYRNSLVIKNTGIHFLLIGFSLLITYQLHLTWVMYIPFIAVLFVKEVKRNTNALWKVPLFLIMGMLISGSLLIPTLLDYGGAIYQNTEGNLNFRPARFGRIFELFARYFSYATFDIIIYNFFELAMNKSLLTLILLWIVKIFSFVQFAVVVISLFFVKRTKEFKNTVLLFVLTLVAALVLFTIANKHLSSRTYLLLYPIPIWLSFYGYNFLFKSKLWIQPLKVFGSKIKLKLSWMKQSMYLAVVITFLAYLGVAITNKGDEFSFEAKKQELEATFEKEDPKEFGKRRTSLMDQYK